MEDKTMSMEAVEKLRVELAALTGRRVEIVEDILNPADHSPVSISSVTYVGSSKTFTDGDVILIQSPTIEAQIRALKWLMKYHTPVKHRGIKVGKRSTSKQKSDARTPDFYAPVDFDDYSSDVVRSSKKVDYDDNTDDELSMSYEESMETLAGIYSGRHEPETEQDEYDVEMVEEEVLDDEIYEEETYEEEIEELPVEIFGEEYDGRYETEGNKIA